MVGGNDAVGRPKRRFGAAPEKEQRRRNGLSTRQHPAPRRLALLHLTPVRRDECEQGHRHKPARLGQPPKRSSGGGMVSARANTRRPAALRCCT
ncbi:MAG: hypothetical protein KatS3mg058_4592 [Roseiflexus sp.]|nr:MAG: hypothetical protein KatS3mg058_4592 [Roseiflexus sp.]